MPTHVEALTSEEDSNATITVTRILRGQPRRQLRVHGPFDLAKTEGTLAVELVGIDKNILNIAGGGNKMRYFFSAG